MRLKKVFCINCKYYRRSLNRTPIGSIPYNCIKQIPDGFDYVEGKTKMKTLNAYESNGDGLCKYFEAVKNENT